jgi:hypothetical protein
MIMANSGLRWHQELAMIMNRAASMSLNILYVYSTLA